MKIVTDNRVALFVGQRNGQIVIPPFTAMGVEQQGEIVAGAIFRNFIGPDCDVMVVGNLEAFTPGFVRSIGRYVFDQLGCCRLSMTTDQPRVIELATRLGAKVEGLKRDGFGVGRDATLLGVLRSEWKFK
jgi:hypothetical protein